MSGKEKAAEVGLALIASLVGSVITLAGNGFFAEKSAPLEKRVRTLEIENAQVSVQYSEIIRRLDRFESKIDGWRK